MFRNVQQQPFFQPFLLSDLRVICGGGGGALHHKTKTSALHSLDVSITFSLLSLSHVYKNHHLYQLFPPTFPSQYTDTAVGKKKSE